MARLEEKLVESGTDVPPSVPEGTHVDVSGRGRLFAREAQGPRGAPTLLLLHGWIATGALNWQHAFEPLRKHFRVIAPDLRGHGQGPRSWRRFRLEDCADDVAALLDHLDTGPVIAAGYSMGGPVAQLLWRHHRDRVAGLVFCATSDRMTVGRAQRFAHKAVMGTVAGATRLGEIHTQVPRWAARRMRPRRSSAHSSRSSNWGMAEIRGHDLRLLMDAGYALSRHDAKAWIGEVDVPTSVVVTREDRAIPARIQRDMALRIRGAKVYEVAAGHMLCSSPDFAAPLVAGCLDVKRRAFARAGASRTRRRTRLA